MTCNAQTRGLLSRSKPGMLSLVNQSIASGTTFLTGVIIGRFCTQEDFGLYSLGFSIVFVLLSLQNSLISTPYMVHSPRLQGSRQADYTASILLHQLLLSGVAALVIAAAAVLFHFQESDRLAAVLAALALAVTAILMRDCIRQICFAHLQMHVATAVDVTVSILQLGGLLALAKLGILTAESSYFVAGAAALVASAGWVLYTRQKPHRDPGLAYADFRTGWATAKWVFASSVVWNVSANIYPWLLAYFHGPAANGVWAACLGVAALGNPIIVGAQNYIGPKISHAFAAGGIKEVRRHLAAGLPIVVLLVLPISIFLLFFGETAVAMIYTSRYAGHGAIMGVIALNLIMTSIDFPISRSLFAIERADLDLVVNLVALLVVMTAGWWFVRAFGPLGVAIALTVSNTAVVAARALAFLLQMRTALVQVAG